MNTLAIVANGPTRDQAPHDDENYDVWTMNNHVLLWQKRTTGVFEMHPDAFNATIYNDEYKDWLRQPHDFPIFTHARTPDIPSSVPFPRAEIQKRWGVNLYKGSGRIENFYTSTFPYCLALALHVGYRDVEMYGVDLNKEERIQHRDAVFFWMGICLAHGMTITIPEQSPLMDEGLYPLIPRNPLR